MSEFQFLKIKDYEPYEHKHCSILVFDILGSNNQLVDVSFKEELPNGLTYCTFEVALEEMGINEVNQLYSELSKLTAVSVYNYFAMHTDKYELIPIRRKNDSEGKES